MNIAPWVYSPHGIFFVTCKWALSARVFVPASFSDLEWYNTLVCWATSKLQRKWRVVNTAPRVYSPHCIFFVTCKWGLNQLECLSQQAFPALCNLTLQLVEPTNKLQRKGRVVNTAPGVYSPHGIFFVTYELPKEARVLFLVSLYRLVWYNTLACWAIS